VKDAPRTGRCENRFRGSYAIVGKKSSGEAFFIAKLFLFFPARLSRYNTRQQPLREKS